MLTVRQVLRLHCSRADQVRQTVVVLHRDFLDIFSEDRMHMSHIFIDSKDVSILLSEMVDKYSLAGGCREDKDTRGLSPILNRKRVPQHS